MSEMIVMSWLLALSVASDSALTASARIDETELKVGSTADLVVDISVPEDLSISDAGMPKPLLQIQVPDSVRLEGKVLTTRKELSRNEYLSAPFERAVGPGSNRIAFMLTGTPQPGAHFGLNVIAYASNADGQGARFVRKRLEVPLKPGASSREVPPTESAWGNDSTLQIGQKAQAFELPKADGTRFDLENLIGKKNILVTTYRAHW